MRIYVVRSAGVGAISTVSRRVPESGLFGIHLNPKGQAEVSFEGACDFSVAGKLMEVGRTERSVTVMPTALSGSGSIIIHRDDGDIEAHVMLDEAYPVVPTFTTLEQIMDLRYELPEI